MYNQIHYNRKYDKYAIPTNLFYIMKDLKFARKVNCSLFEIDFP